MLVFINSKILLSVFLLLLFMYWVVFIILGIVAALRWAEAISCCVFPSYRISRSRNAARDDMELNTSLHLHVYAWILFCGDLQK